MGEPLATFTELGTYLGTTVDTDRAILVLQLAHDMCETVVSPVPALAKGVELAVAARAYTNITSAHQMSLGSAAMSFGAQNSTMGVGGLYVSKSEKATLRRLSGRSGAFSIDMLLGTIPPTEVPHIDTATPSSGAAAGDLVALTGYGFYGAVSVTVGGTSATFTVVSDTSLAFALPVGGSGAVDVVVTNGIGASSAFPYTRS